MPQYIYTICQVGAEKALKEEVSRVYPALSFSFSRPGFVTFLNKGEEWRPDFEFLVIFARAFGISALRATDDEVNEKIKEVIPLLPSKRRLKLHVWERDLFFPGDEPAGFQFSAEADKKRKELMALFPKVFDPDTTPLEGDRVLDVIRMEGAGENSPGQWWIGYHFHHEGHTRFAGGRPRIDMPEDAPSRAYLKLIEGLLKTGVSPTAGQTALEMGCTPGGTLYGLLERGLQVIGVDPNPVSPVILRKFGKKFFFMQRPAEAFLPSHDFAPEKLDWLFLDVNRSPDELLPQVEIWVKHHVRHLQGVFLTLKLMSWEKIAEIPRWMDRIQDMGLQIEFVQQLAHNRQEFLVFAKPPVSAKPEPTKPGFKGKRTSRR